MTVKIKFPIWKTRSVGVAAYKIRDNRELEVEITYKDKSGERLYPPPPAKMPVWKYHSPIRAGNAKRGGGMRGVPPMLTPRGPVTSLNIRGSPL